MGFPGKSLSVILSQILFLPFYVQAGRAVEMADKLRASGQIYVVIAVLVIIFLGMVVFLVSIDKRLKHLEKRAKDLNK